MQDWPLEVADETRLQEFCDFYESESLDHDTRFALMEVIVHSLDGAISGDRNDAKKIEGHKIERRVEALLRRDFVLHFHAVNYWRCHNDEIDPDPLPESERGFAVTPMMRRIWKDCFIPEYSRWFEWFDPQ